MSRRRGQDGSLENRNGRWTVRYWVDVPGQDKRDRPRHTLGPSKGPGKLTYSEARRLAREFIASTGADSVEHLQKVQAATTGTTFAQQAERWLAHMRERKRNPTSPKTTDDWQYTLGKWLNPDLGPLPLYAVNQKVVAALVVKMTAAGLGPKSIQNYIQIVKMVRASVLNDDGQPLHPIVWSDDFMDIPIVRQHDQKRPTFTSDEVTKIVAAAQGKYQVLFALLAGTGMRVGEALALDVRHLVDTSMLTVRTSAYYKLIKRTKTDNGWRDLDIHPLLGQMLRNFIGGRKEGFIFGTVGTGKNGDRLSGKPDTQQNILHRALHPALKAVGLEKRGEHAFRRFRVTHLRKQWRIGFPRDLEHYWLGHKPQHVSDLYSALKDDVEFRQEWAEKVGLGFELPITSKIQLDPMDPETQVQNVA